jgi:hypothetical protein
VSPIDDSLREELSALLDDALPPERAAELRRRIEADPELSREYEELARAVEAVRALPRAHAPAALRARLDEAAGARPPGRIVRFTWFLAAAACVALTTAVALQFRGGAKPQQLEARRDAPAEAPESQATDERFGEPLEEKAVASEAVSGAPAGREEVARDAVPPAPAASAGRDEKVAREAAPQATAEPAGREEKLGGARGGSRAKGAEAEAKRQAPDLIGAIEAAGKVGPVDRKAYLRQLGALDAVEAREHFRRLFPDEGAVKERELKLEKREDAAPPVLEAILLVDKDEANLVAKVLGGATPSAAGLTVEQPAKDRVEVAEVEGTAEELRRLARWLALLDLTPRAPSGPRAAPPKDDAAKEAADRERKVRAVVELRYGKPPEPAAGAAGK